MTNSPQDSAIYWFRNDLRLHDNEALSHAVTKNKSVLFVYIFDSSCFESEIFGYKKIGVHRVQFLLEAVADLRKRIEAKGGKLLIAHGKPSELLVGLCNEYACKRVYAHNSVTDEELKLLKSVEQELWHAKAELLLFEENTLVHKLDLGFPIKSLPDKFTDFRKQIEKYVNIRPCLPTPKLLISPSVVNEGTLPTSKELLGASSSLEHNFHKDDMKFTGGETHALARLDYYVWDKKLVHTYKESRNGLLGGDYSTKVSPWLATGSISARFIYHEIKRYEKKFGNNESTYWVFFELLWRDFFHFVAMKYGNLIFQEGGIFNKPNYKRHNPFLVNKWVKGETGNPFIDANMKELMHTGFMSNRGRQNVASYFVNDLKQDWRIGAAYFESMLIDYDVCSNYGNWIYLAGVGNDPRDNRYFNTIKQANTYDPKGLYIHHWLPNLKKVQPPELFENQ